MSHFIIILVYSMRRFTAIWPECDSDLDVVPIPGVTRKTWRREEVLDMASVH
jgi:hypothetical protein